MVNMYITKIVEPEYIFSCMSVVSFSAAVLTNGIKMLKSSKKNSKIAGILSIGIALLIICTVILLEIFF
jgi:hypothetical protein